MTKTTTQKPTPAAAVPTPPILAIERVFHATPQRLWRYWTVPELYAKWFNPSPADLVIHEFDARAGGRIRFDMPQPDGNKNPQEGVFHSLTPCTEIVSGAPDRSFLLTVRFSPVGKPEDRKTRMTVQVQGVPAEHHAMATKGWNAGLDKLSAQVGRPERHATKGQVTKDRYVLVERWLKAPPEKVFKAWSDPKLLPRFFWPLGTGRIEELAFRPGGRLVMAHTTQPWTATWEFLAIVPNRSITIRDIWPDGSGAEATGTLEFIAQDGGTLMKVRHGPFPTTGPYQPEGAVQGFGMVADRLAEEVELPGPGEGFTIERYFQAKPERVWRMWTTKEGLAKWWGPSANAMGYEFRVNQLDVRVGGGYDIQMSNKKQGELHNHGTYTEVVPNKRLAQRWEFDIFLAPGEKPYPIAITIDLEEVPGMDPSQTATRMTFTQGPMARPEFTEGSRQGVIQNLAHLEKALA